LGLRRSLHFCWTILEKSHSDRTGATALDTKDSVRSVEVPLSSGFSLVLQRKSLELLPGGSGS
jgi:hypothetical protein